MGFKEGDGTRVCARARVWDGQWTVRAIKGRFSGLRSVVNRLQGVGHG
jgi:hypothetical protein